MIEVKQDKAASEPLNIPVYSANSAQIASNGVDVLITFSAFVPVGSEDGLANSPRCAISLSRGAALELQSVMKTVLDQLDAEFGAIDTPFLRERRK